MMEDAKEDEAEEIGQHLSKVTLDGDNNRSTTCWTSIGVSVCDVAEGAACDGCNDKCSGFVAHNFRKECKICKCLRQCHRPSVGEEESGKTTTHSWVPVGLTPSKVEEYFNQLPNHKVPRVGSPGQSYHLKQLMLQLPKQDLAWSNCKHLDGTYQRSFQDFVRDRDELVLDVGYVKDADNTHTECHKCGGVLAEGEVSVVAAKLGAQRRWHPACFVCSSCDELLVELVYCTHKEQLYCPRHYDELIRPRCAACDELIYAGEYAKAMSQDWHCEHFCCWQCDEELNGQSYVVSGQQPYCTRCYEQLFASVCQACAKAIGVDSKELRYKEKQWHEVCFVCHRCRASLVGKAFGAQDERVYCAACYEAHYASRCDACALPFPAGAKKMEYKGRLFHDQCFSCGACQQPIGSRSFVPKDDLFYCVDCYEDKFATRCVKCNKVISSGGVTYKGEPWHAECFTCSHCNGPLAGQRFAKRDEKPFCAECYGELFAKRCTACTRPITAGVGGGRFISYEDRQWHNECFVCATCRSSLVGRGFITDGADMLCPDCAKQRLL